MFKKGDRFRHRNCLDTDIIVSKVVSQDTNSTYLEIYYYNRHYRAIILPKTEVVEIEQSQFANWSKIEENFL